MQRRHSLKQRHIKNNAIKINNTSIDRGMYQGDSLPPLLFCLALFPLQPNCSIIQTWRGGGYKNTISHLFYMNDLKFYVENDNDLKPLLEMDFNDDIRMEFGLDKCAKAMFKAGISSNVVPDINTSIKKLQ